MMAKMPALPPRAAAGAAGKIHTSRNQGAAGRGGSRLQPAHPASLEQGLGCSPSLSQRCRQCLHLLQALVIGLLIFFMGLHHNDTSGALGARGRTQVLHRREEKLQGTGGTAYQPNQAHSQVLLVNITFKTISDVCHHLDSALKPWSSKPVLNIPTWSTVLFLWAGQGLSARL